MEIKGRITQVEFEPYNYFRVRGMVNSTFNDSRIWEEDANAGFTIKWFWFDTSMPPEVLMAFKKIMIVIDAELQRCGILPKKWPGVLNDTCPDSDIFKFNIKKYSIANPNWLSARELNHVISVTASSKWFTDEKGLAKDVHISLKGEDLRSLFAALENNL